MTRGDLLIIAGAWLIVVGLIWATWQPPYVSPALAEEPCLRITTGTYTRNYPPPGMPLTRRPAEWGTCPPFAPYEEP